MYTSFNPTSGTTALLLLFAFEAVVIGGLGSLWGTLVGGILLGVVQQLGAQVSSNDQILAGQLLFLLILLVRPGSGPPGSGPPGSGPPAAGQPTSQPAVITQDVRVSRSRRSPLWPALGAVVVIAVLAYLPYIVYAGTTSLLVNFFILLIMASMWNLLAGYAGLVSVGQQAFIGLGSYFVLIVGLHGIDPFIGLPVAALGSGVVGLVVWWLLSRLRSGYFAIATWVIASICYLIVIRFASLGGGTGEPLPSMPTISNTLLNAYTYWVPSRSR